MRKAILGGGTFGLTSTIRLPHKKHLETSLNNHSVQLRHVSLQFILPENSINALEFMSDSYSSHLVDQQVSGSIKIQNYTLTKTVNSPLITQMGAEARSLMKCLSTNNKNQKPIILVIQESVCRLADRYLTQVSLQGISQTL
ncbi:hypothetical protein EBS43_11365, partial [bacterium]|nr:hypothetical protein [bacterium]